MLDEVKAITFDTLAVAIAFTVAFALVIWVVAPAQDVAVGSSFYGSLCFLPHGVRVFAVALLGWRAAPGLFLGAYGGDFILNGADADVTSLALAKFGVINFLAPMAAIKLLELGGVTVSTQLARQTAWRFLILVSGIASIFNAAATALIVDQYDLQSDTFTAGVLEVGYIALGDIIGTVALLGLILLVRNYWRKMSNDPDGIL